MLKKGVASIKKDKDGYSLGAEWITDETEREAYLFNIERVQNDKSFKNMPAAYQRTHDGELTAEDNKFLLEIEEMNAIANEFLNANSQYVVFENAGGMGLVDTIRDLFDAFTSKNKNRTKDIEKMSDEFKLELQKITGNAMANAAIDELTSWGESGDAFLRWATEDANRDGVVTDKESKEIQAATVDALMSRALRGEDVEGILKGLLESISDTKLKKELIEMAKQLSELAGQRYLNKPETFFNKLNTLATNMVNKLSGKDGVLKALQTESDFYSRKVNTNTAKATINGIKGQIKSMAENAYLLKGLEFNQELFDKCFSSASSTVLAELDNGNGASLNNILNKFVNAFNSEWVGQSLSDIAEKSK